MQGGSAGDTAAAAVGGPGTVAGDMGNTGDTGNTENMGNAGNIGNAGNTAAAIGGGKPPRAPVQRDRKVRQMAYSTRISDFLDFLRDCQQEYNISVMREEDANNETQDLLHCLELRQNGYHDLARISRTLRRVRQERREAKDAERGLLPIVEWTSQNRKTVNELERLLGAVRAAEKSSAGRTYTPKTNILKEISGGE